MLTIRREQMEALSAYMRQSFEDRMVRHLAQSFPAPFKKLAASQANDEPVRALLREGITQAAKYGFSSERDLRQFIDLIMELGPDFETNPETAWVTGILKDHAVPSPARLDLVAQQIQARAVVTLPNPSRGL
jgi:hypothetical protein